MDIQSNIAGFDTANMSEYNFLLFAKRMRELANEFYADEDNRRAYDEWMKSSCGGRRTIHEG